MIAFLTCSGPDRALAVVEDLVERFAQGSRERGLVRACLTLYSMTELRLIKAGIGLDDELLRHLTAKGIPYVDTALYILEHYPRWTPQNRPVRQPPQARVLYRDGCRASKAPKEAVAGGIAGYGRAPQRGSWGPSAMRYGSHEAGRSGWRRVRQLFGPQVRT
jgi:hypothetical protein